MKERILKLAAGLVGGFFLGVLIALLLTLSLPHKNGIAPVAGAISFFVAIVAGVVFAFFSPSPSKALRRLLLTCSVLAVLLPLSGLLFTGDMMTNFAPESSEHSGAYQAGTAIGGGLISGVLGFVGFFSGVIFLIIGLLVGRDKQVIYVQAPAVTETTRT